MLIIKSLLLATSMFGTPTNIAATTGYISPICKISKVKADPQNVAFVFDLHDVLFKLNTNKAVRAFFACNQKTTFLNGVIDFAKVKVISKDKENAKLCIENALTDENGAIIDNALDILNAHEPILEMTNLVKTLKTKGYKLFLCSNIGERSYKYLAEKYKDIFDLFDDVIIPRKENNYVTKASVKLFEACASSVIGQLPGENLKIIFIDDSAKNIAKAESIGFIGIQFTTVGDIKPALNRFIR